jgi:YesN/AraC family two-component response regulator
LAREAGPDLVLADVMMPEMDGFDLSRALKTDPQTEGIPVILLTARAAEQDELDGLATEADDYIIKPFVPRLLLARVQNLIHLRQRLRARFQADGHPTSGADPPDLSESVRLIRSVIIEHLSDPNLTVQALGELCGLSYSALYSHLRNELDLHPSQYIRRIRLERAAELLKEGSWTVAEVGYGVGFNSHSYFSSRFREEFGMTPSEYKGRQTA